LIASAGEKAQSGLPIKKVVSKAEDLKPKALNLSESLISMEND